MDTDVILKKINTNTKNKTKTKAKLERSITQTCTLKHNSTQNSDVKTGY